MNSERVITKTQERVKVMTAFINGENIEGSAYCNKVGYVVDTSPTWNWSKYNYRVAKQASFIDRLVRWAPIMVLQPLTQQCDTPVWLASVFYYENKAHIEEQQGDLAVSADYWAKLRLPTVSEAPKNVWLVPWDDQPTELEAYDRAFTLKNGNIVQFSSTSSSVSINWNDVKSIMLLGAKND